MGIGDLFVKYCVHCCRDRTHSINDPWCQCCMDARDKGYRHGVAVTKNKILDYIKNLRKDETSKPK